MRIRYWSSDVCSSDLSEEAPSPAGTVRGMHYQLPPHEETKLVRCVRGGIVDVIVDVRSDSPTFRRWIAVELTAANRRALLVPRGFAHGYQTLADDTEVFYQVSAYYTPGAERGLRHDDPAIGIERSEEHTSELQSLMRISYAVFCLKKNKTH